jgi:hypothetical protein
MGARDGAENGIVQVLGVAHNPPARLFILLILQPNLLFSITAGIFFGLPPPGLQKSQGCLQNVQSFREALRILLELTPAITRQLTRLNPAHLAIGRPAARSRAGEG